MAKKLTTEDLVLNIIVNSNKAQSEIGKLGRTIQDNTSKLKSAEAEMKKLEKANATSSARYKELQSDVTKYNTVINESKTRLGELNQTMSLQDKSLKQLEQSLRRTRQLWRQATTDNDRKRYADEMEMLNKRIGELRNGGEQTGNALMRMSSKIQQHFAVITAGIASFMAAFSGIRRATTEYARFDDVLADVMKTTNLSKDAARELNEELKEIETRTSQEDRLGLARIAGKLGYSDIEEITEFVRANNQIIVALNEDLGGNVEETVNKIGKLVDIFKLRDLYDTEEAFLKVGSAINELGMASTANEGYMVEFARRMAGVAPLAGITIEEVLGLGAALDQLGQTEEVSSTALSKLFLAMAKDASTYAKYAGMELKQFQDYMEEDFMGAFTRVLQGVRNNSEGINALAATLGDLGQDGGRVIGVIGSLADNVDTLTSSIELSNTAMEKGNSVTDEYNIKNETAAAKLEMAKNQATNLWVELGEKLWPAMTEGLSLYTTFLLLLSKTITFISNNIRVISSLTIAIVTYYTAVQLAAKWEAITTAAIAAKNIVVKGAIISYGLFTGSITRAAAAQQLLNLRMMANPYGIALAALAALISYIIIGRKETDAYTRSQRNLETAASNAKSETELETTAIKESLRVIINQKEAIEQKKEAIDRLRRIMPDVLKDYTDEQILAGEATKAIKAQSEAIVLRAKARLEEELLMEEMRKRMDNDARNWEDLSGMDQAGYYVKGFFTGNRPINLFLKDWEKVDRQVNGTIEVYKNSLSATNSELEAILRKVKSNDDPNGTVVVPGSGGKDEKGKTAADRQAERDKKSQEKMLADQEKYRQQVLLKQKSLTDQERAAHDERLKQAGIYGIEREKLSEQQMQVLEALEKQHQENLDKIDSDAIAKEIDTRLAAHREEIADLRIANQEELAEVRTLAQAKEMLSGVMSERELAQIRDLRQARRLIQNQQRLEEETVLRAHLIELADIVSRAQETGLFDGLDLSDDILSEEEKKVLTDRLRQIKEELAKLKGQDRTDEVKDRAVTKTDVLGMSVSDWELLFQNIEQGKISLEQLYDVMGSVSQMWQQYSNLVATKENAMLQRDQDANERKKENLRKRLDDGTLTQESYNKQVEKLDREMDTKRAEIQRKQAKREKAAALMSAIVNTARAVTAVLPNWILAALVGAFGAVQIGTIASTPLPSMEGRESGGYLKVERSQDGKVFNAKVDPERRGFVQEPTVIVGENGSEWVASAKAVKNPTVRPILDVLDTAQKNGTISTLNLQDIIAGTLGRRSVQGREVGGYVNRENNRSDNGQDQRIYEVLNRLDGTVSKLDIGLKNLKAEVAIIGKNGFLEKWTEYNDIEQDANL